MKGIDSGTGGITRRRYAPRNTTSIRPNGTSVAQKDRPHRLSSANLNDSPSRWNGPNSFSKRSATITSRKENETSSDELLKKKSVYMLRSVPRQKLRIAMR